MESMYSLQQRANGWVILVGGHEILTCSQRAIAVRVIQQAAGHLGLGEQVLGPPAETGPDEIGFAAAQPAV